MPLFTSKALRVVVSAAIASVFSTVAEANELRRGAAAGRKLDPGLPLNTYVALLDANETCENLSSIVIGNGGTIPLCHAETGVVILKIQETQMDDVLPCLACIESDVSFSWDDEPPTDPREFVEDAAGRRRAMADDPESAIFFASQWNMRAIEADKAWECGRLGSEDVTVAILDSGIDYGHPELAGRVDLSRSVSFVPTDDDLVDEFFPGRHHVTDLHYHGTHVANTVVSNAFAVAGVTSKTTLIGVKVGGVNGPSFSAIVQGLIHAVNNGADVANLSLGAYALSANYGGLVDIFAAIYTWAHSEGMTVVVAAGNSAIDLDGDGPLYYSAFCDTPNVICVAATGPVASGSVDGPFYDVDYPAGYTNFGTEAIDVAAPGGTQGGLVWAACSETSLVIPACQVGFGLIGIGGTSMAAPHVAGLAALLVEDLGRMPDQIKEKIEQTAEDLERADYDPYPLEAIEDFGPYYGGNGRINVANAVCPAMCCSDGISGWYPVAVGGEPCAGFVHCNGMMQTAVQNCPVGLQFNPNYGENGGCDWPADANCPPADRLCMPGAGSDRRRE